MLCLIQQRAINNNPLLLSCQWCNFLFYIFAFPSLFLRADRHWNLQYDFSIPAHTVAGGLHSSPAVAGQSVTPVTHHTQRPRLPPASTPSLLCCIPLSGLELSAATIGFFLHHKTPGMARLGYPKRSLIIHKQQLLIDAHLRRCCFSCTAYTYIRQMTTPWLLENNSFAQTSHISKDLSLSVICLLPSQNLKMAWENNQYCN